MLSKTGTYSIQETVDGNRGADPDDPGGLSPVVRRPCRVTGHVASVLDDINDRNPGLKERLIEADGLRRFVNVYVNDEDVRFSGGLSAPTADGDVVVVLPAVAGG